MAVVTHGGGLGVHSEVQFTMSIRIHAYPQGGRWIAASLVLPVIAEAATREEAEQRLIAATLAYIRTALEHGWLDALIARPSFLRRLEIRRRVVIAKVLGRHPKIRTQVLRLG